MNFTWTKLLNLSNLPISDWWQASYLSRLFGLLANWREGSWLLKWEKWLGGLLIGVVLCLAPFVSTSLIGVLLLAIAAYWLLLIISESNRLSVTPIHCLVFIYWCITTLAVAFSPVRQAAFSGWIKLTLYLILFALAARVLRSIKVTNWLITSILLTSLIVSVYGIRQEFYGVEQLATWNDPTSALAGDTRVYSYLGNPNLLGGYLLPIIALAIAALFVWQGILPKILAGTIILLNSACLYLTDSRGAWLGMLGSVIVFGLLFRYWWQNYLPRFWRIWLLPLLFGILGSAILVAIVFLEPLRLRVLSIFAGRGDSSNNFRINVWIAVKNMILDRPLLGIGPGNQAFNQVYPLYMVSPRYPALSAYSILLETAVETGIIGLSCFLGLIAVALNQGIKRLQQLRITRSRQAFWLMAAIAGITGMLIHGSVDTVWYRPQINTLWWFLLAIITSQYPLASETGILNHEKSV